MLTDDRLPGTSGLSMVTRAHEEGLVGHTQVLLLTADPAAQTNDWLTVLRKPLGAQKLVLAIGALLTSVRERPN